MKCYRCNHILPEDSEFCQYCGSDLKQNNNTSESRPSKQKTNFKYIIIFTVTIVTLVALNIVQIFTIKKSEVTISKQKSTISELEKKQSELEKDIVEKDFEISSLIIKYKNISDELDTTKRMLERLYD